MFEDNYLNITLNDAEVYFLAQEAKLKQIIGLGIDYEAINKETKVELKQQVYDSLEKKALLQMDFSGNSTVEESTAKILKEFEKPQRCMVYQFHNNTEDFSTMRKVYDNSRNYLALEYFTQNDFGLYRLEHDCDIDAFLFAEERIDAVEIEENAEIQFAEEKIDNIEQAVEESQCFAIVTDFQYLPENDTYAFSQCAYLKISDIWYYMETKGDEDISIHPVTELVRF